MDNFIMAKYCRCILKLLHIPYVDIQKFNIKYLVMHKVQMHTGAIILLEYGSCVWTGDNPVQLHKPYSNYH